MKKQIGLGVLALGVALLAACTTTQTPNATTAQGTPMVKQFKVGETCPEHMNVKVGDTFSVALSENPSTGYSWQLQPTDNDLFTVQSKVDDSTKKTDVVGAPNVRVFTFVAVKKGQQALQINYARPWEKVAPAQTWACHIMVN